ncbi:conserved protein of unknown function [Methylorubrum extorquens DM4]|uniref:Transglycosylase SLT domain-containing protein n=1 Tax=Methylorubrum extorquens (strain DSM 6343 / CIP 106787 / DM4) TaxID=661410 RepID=C7CLB5_METED|nr:transglycosylase SLT domain-containing protein [Methylorubrum extorquens]CAX24744.1 conserved protein of unknown function [Methylorubrum extorquens DM4]
MFLFNNSPVATRETAAPARAAAASGEVVDAIREGAQTSGVGFDYLLATAQRESSLNPSAKASTSTATGLFQFIEQTWLGVMKNAGPKLGLSSYADAISSGADGRYSVADPAARQAILDLRRDPKVSAAMAGALTQRNGEALSAALGREPNAGDLYAAHVLGAKGASALIASAQTNPSRPAALDMPEAAAANRSLFYDRAGRPRSASELYGLLSQTTSGVATPVATAAADANPPTSYASLEGGLRSLFQTDRRQGAVSEGVAKLWQNRAAASTAERTGPTYFPRSDAWNETESTAAPSAARSDITTTGTAVAETAAASEAIVVPLPPRRPAGLTAMAAATTTFMAGPTTDRPPATPAKNSLFDPSAFRLRSGS